MKKANGEQVRIIHVLLNKIGIIEEKQDFVNQFTNGRTTSTREMAITEATSLIYYLRGLEPSENSAVKMRMKIISMAHEMGWQLEERKPNGKKKIDMVHVNNWCIKHGHGKKKLDDYTQKELPALVSQMESVYRQYITKT